MPNNLNLVPISINVFAQQLNIVTANILPTIGAPAFANPVGEFF
jgi:hypothetical protein